jgi:L-ascorbate metabolism protein UlaG (beta-lactamase superfamily)
MNAEDSYWLNHIHWLGHDSYQIDEPMVIYIDPWHLPAGSPPADVILVSHEHFDHCSPEDVESVRQATTRVYANPGAAEKLQGEVNILTPGDIVELEGLTLEALPAYNTDKDFHPKAAQHLAFILEAEGERLYFAGDTDQIPEMEGLNCQPMHYDAGVVGTIEDAQRFQELTSSNVVILENEGVPKEERS